MCHQIVIRDCSTDSIVHSCTDLIGQSCTDSMVIELDCNTEFHRRKLN